jgi:hypothetical protein
METDARLSAADVRAIEQALVPLRHNAGWYANQCARLCAALRAESLATLQAQQRGECEADLMRLLTERQDRSAEDTELFGMILSNLLQVRQRNAQLDVANARLERALLSLLEFPHTPGCLAIANEHYACSCPRHAVLKLVEDGLASYLPQSHMEDRTRESHAA